MNAAEMKRHIEALLESANMAVDALTPRASWELFKTLLCEPIDDGELRDDEANFQCGRRVWGDGRLGPSVYFLRYFCVWNEEAQGYLTTGPDQDERLGFAFGFLYPQRLADSFGEEMYDRADYRSLEEFILAVEAAPEFHVAMTNAPDRCELDIDAPSP